MKRLFTKHISVLRLLAVSGCAASCMLAPSALHAQTYYSQFSDPRAGYDYAVINPTGCGAPTIQNGVGEADNYNSNDADNTFAYFKISNLTAPYSCNTDPGGERYKFNVNLNLPSDTPSLDAGVDVGFKIRIPSGISRDNLGKYIVIGTYLVNAEHSDATFQEFVASDVLRGKALDQNADGKTWIIHFTTTKPMNDLELSVDPNIGMLDPNFEFDVFYGYGAINDGPLPAQIANFKAAVSGKTVGLTWQSLTETNVKGYRIERSSDGGTNYTPVAVVSAKGNSNAAVNYGYNDNGLTDGKYLYRLVILDKSGTLKSSSSVAATISGQGQFLVYPTVIKAGQNVTVKTSETGDVTIHVFDGTGRLVKQQRINSNGQFTIATSNLSTGVYTVKIVSASGNVSQSRIMVN